MGCIAKINYHIFTFFLLTTSLPCLSTDANTQVQARIIGGIRSNVNTWPWMAGLVKKKLRTFDGTYCGASLVAKQWVLTAAHCVAKYTPDDIDVIVNKAHLDSDNGERTGIERIIIHPLFDSDTLDNDIALVKLSTPSSSRPITLLPAHSDEATAEAPVTAIGWGTISAAKNLFPESLHQVDLSLISNEQCATAYDSLTDNMICTNSISGVKDTCQGDSGGPLVIFDSSSKTWRQVGITSWGYGCAVKGFYGVYTRLQKYIPFISDTICSVSEVPHPTSLKLTLTDNRVKATWDESAIGDYHYRINLAPFPEGFPIQSIDLNNLTQYSTTLTPDSAIYIGITRYKDNCNSKLSNVEYVKFQIPAVNKSNK
jgi:secreted trypsin-like serine protease